MTPCIFIISTSHLVHEKSIGLWDYMGWMLFGVGFVIQTLSDIQKHNFRSEKANAKKVCTVGLWRFSRHPNFCGEVMMWWGMFIAGVPVFCVFPAGYATVASPLFTMFVLLFASGIPQAEGAASARWFDGGDSQAMYEAYFEATPPLWLFPPSIYKRLPLCVKRLLCFELPMYRYEPRGELLAR
jgi:steroid 5-alpha reductase family enzyme